MSNLFKHLFWLFLLIISSLAYTQASDRDAFQLNQTKKYTTKDHPKAKGINIVLEYPNNWEAKEGERPNIVQKFSRAFDNETSVMCIILIKYFPSEVKIFSDEDIAEEMFSEEVMKSMFSGNSELLEHIRTKYDGQPGALSSFAIVQERTGFEIFSYVLQHSFIYSKRIILIQCSVSGLSANSEEVHELYKSYTPLFIQIGNSIVIPDKWKKYTVNEDLSNNEISSEEYGRTTLLISALLTWGVGLLPPILIRFVFARKPLPKKIAIMFVVILWFLNLIIFISIGSQSKTHAVLFLVALVSYYILIKEKKVNEIKKSNNVF